MMNEDVAQTAGYATVRDRTLHIVGDIVGSSPGSSDLETVLVEHFRNLSSCRLSGLACILHHGLARAARTKPVIGAASP